MKGRGQSYIKLFALMTPVELVRTHALINGLILGKTEPLLMTIR